jgi:hypothetical protein
LAATYLPHSSPKVGTMRFTARRLQSTAAQGTHSVGTEDTVLPDRRMAELHASAPYICMHGQHAKAFKQSLLFEIVTRNMHDRPAPTPAVIYCHEAVGCSLEGQCPGFIDSICPAPLKGDLSCCPSTETQEGN